jgi:hypothetical protein
MLKLKIISVALFFLVTKNIYAQEIQGISLKMIEEMTQNKEGVYYYQTLTDKLHQGDTSLVYTDYLMLYYGFVYQKNYHPYKHIVWEDSLSKLTDQKNAPKALELSEKILKENPVSLTAHIERAYTLHAVKKEKESFKHLQIYAKLSDVILQSGTGESYQKPIIVISPKDTEIILMRFKLNIISKSINGQEDKYYLVYLVKNQEGNQYPIYFDITLAYSIGMEKVKNK